MPELPEVQTTVNGLNRTIRGLKIVDVWTDYNSLFQKGKDSVKDPTYFKYFKKEVVGAKVLGASRRAKNILVSIQKNNKNLVILVHMKMTGHLMYGDYDRADPFNRFIHLVFTFGNGKTLELSDMRKFAKVTLIHEKDLAKTVHLEHIGPDPLDRSFTLEVFKERLGRKPNGRIKTVLMDQSVIAGIGNIYSDEALWQVGLHPEERVKNIPDPLLKKLHDAAKTVLKKGIDFGGDSMSDYRNIDGKRGRFQGQHNVYRKTGEHCSKPGCKGIILRKVVGGRSAHFCSMHQRFIKYAVNQAV
jgi:formamidopyrimidine-DNA glycosylase